MRESEKTAAEAAGSSATLFTRAREHTKKVTRLIQETLGPGDSWTKTCQACSVGTVSLDVQETVISSKPDLSLVWGDCPECRTRTTLQNAGVPMNLAGATLDSWMVQVPDDMVALTKVKAFSQCPVGFFVISSPEFGNGKSHLAVGLMRAVLTNGFRMASKIRFITQADVLRGIRRRYDDSRAEDMVARLSTVQLLVLDDFGVSAGGKDEAPALYDILSERYAEKRPTVLTMNLSPEQFREAIGARMASRLREATFAWADVHGSSFRSAKRKTYLQG